MLKTRRGNQYWLITQPDHAALSGAMAAHWGNREFARPGQYAASRGADRLRQEVELAIAEHDNGWWEWEAEPPLSAGDGLPQGLGEAIQRPLEGMDRWRVGIGRLASQHPYASLIISYHAYWLYAVQLEPDPPPEFTHHLQGTRNNSPKQLDEATQKFLADVRSTQEELRSRIGEPEQVAPHSRLLQILDAMSLSLCSTVIAPVDGEARGFGDDHVVYEQVPRKSWDDLVTLEVRPLGNARMAVSPYPFDTDPLEVAVPVRVASAHQWWRCAPWIRMRFEFLSGARSS